MTRQLMEAYVMNGKITLEVVEIVAAVVKVHPLHNLPFHHLPRQNPIPRLLLHCY
uniref:Uncharacterized protein n=1 Tax=Meloidogyne incognita TaxID=6306 RepID=A0A914L7D8_MELIC